MTKVSNKQETHQTVEDSVAYELELRHDQCFPLCCCWSMLAFATGVGIIVLPCIPSVTSAYLKKRRAYLSEKHLHYNSGIITREQRSIPLDRIQDVRLVENPMDRCCNVKNLVIETAGKSDGMPEVILYTPMDPDGTKQRILDQRDRLVYGTMPPMSAGKMKAPGESSVTQHDDDVWLPKIYESLKRIESYLCTKSAQ